MTVLVTGVAGFIGFHLAKALLERGDRVLGIDSLNDYYDVTLKQARLSQLESFPNFQFLKLDITHRQTVATLFEQHPFDGVLHMAAQAGVRYSVVNPHTYIDNNITGFLHILVVS